MRLHDAWRQGSQDVTAGKTIKDHACDWWFLVLGALQVLFNQFGRHTDDMLTLPVLDHIERLQGADDVTLCDAGHLTAGGGKDVWIKQKKPQNM